MDIRDVIKAGNTAIEAIDLVKDYGSGSNAVHALRGVNIAFEQGRFTAIMGPSGSGKSTLMHTLAGLDSATSGHIMFDGKDLTRMNDDQLTLLRRHQIGFIFQSFNLLPMFTAEQNIECYIGVPAAWHADFALTCHGSSMAPTICDGDIVCIRCQPEVEQGEIAAVRIGDEATLKHFHRQGDTVMLLADNAAVCPPMIYAGPQLNEIQIEGRAVGFCRGL